jgi:hypothetical protein
MVISAVMGLFYKIRIFKEEIDKMKLGIVICELVS